MRTRSRMFVTAAALTALGAGLAFAQSLPSKKVLTFDLANEMAQEAIKVCRAYNQKATVVVVDDGDHVKALLHDDGADIATLDVARMKATTVIVFGGAPSGSGAVGGGGTGGCDAQLTSLASRGADAPPPPAPAVGAPPPAAGPVAGPRLGVPGTLGLGGGQPIKSGDQLIGAIGVSGVTGAGRRVPLGDSGCGCAAIAKVADRLK